ncbi:riboflavin transporter 2 [Acipenser oxyrinchus oxyrinchus]|uniref:Riboflavin transporter n=1 Tax=Acipenser oxyrinchus oxyrinchus TaxID=40147 RepID=A0AAD8GF16_ACIOX|nr:riboflavin transporter 2 [Acipenser oxyrinchus oxyrinchus]
MALLTHTLSCLFGIGSWVAINGMWVELPLIVPDIPEGWYLPSYLTVLIQMANIGPLFVTLMHRFHPGKLSEVAVIYTIIGVGIIASFLLAFFWKETLVVAGSSRSVALLVLTFFLSTVDCTSSVTFLPFMMRLKPQYMTTYFIGEGLSGLVPGLVALVQGVGMVKCINQTQTINGSFGNSTASLELQAWYQPAMFSAQVFFFFLSVMMVVCLGAFLLLNYHPNVRREHKSSRYLEGGIHGENGELSPRENSQPEQKPMISPLESQQPAVQSSFGSGKYSWPECLFLFVVLGWANALTNAVLPAVQSYSCLPYGNNAYHMSATFGAVANPVACFIAMFLPNRSFLLLGVLTLAGTGFGSYIMTTAVLSPCPFLIHYSTGAMLIVMAWVLFVLSLSYVKVMIGVILRDEGHSALVWCGAVVQLGSMLGALTMFPLVSVFGLFKSGDSCNTKCPI